MKIPVFFRPEMLATSGSAISPSAHKPGLLVTTIAKLIRRQPGSSPRCS